MTFSEIWSAIVHKYPVARDPDKVLAFKSKDFKKMLKRVYEKGQKNPKITDPFDDLLDEIL